MTIKMQVNWIGPYQVLIFASIFLILTVYAIYLVLKYEKGYVKLIWILLFFLVPFLFAIIYIANYFIRIRKREQIEL